MKKSSFSFMLALSLSFVLFGQDKVEIKTIDGVPHVLNPAEPLRGRIKVEIARIRTINPFEQPDVGLRFIFFSRDNAGNVVLFDPYGAEGHRFGPDGKYLGLLTKIGQGPGEFSGGQGYRVAFLKSDIRVYGGQKVARLDGNGVFKEERTLKNRFYHGIEGGDYFSENTTMNEKKENIRVLKFVRCAMKGEEKDVVLLQGKNVGMIRDSSGHGFSEAWGTPEYFYDGDPALQRIYCGLSTEYLVRVKDYRGKDLLVVRRPYEYVKVSRSDVVKIMSLDPKEESTKWVISMYPNRLVAIRNVQALPGGFMAVFRVSGMKQIEIDVFDKQGRYQYALELPAGLKTERLKFLPFGFALIESDGDFSVYREYKIKNLPEVFGK